MRSINKRRRANELSTVRRVFKLSRVTRFFLNRPESYQISENDCLVDTTESSNYGWIFKSAIRRRPRWLFRGDAGGRLMRARDDVDEKPRDIPKPERRRAGGHQIDEPPPRAVLC